MTYPFDNGDSMNIQPRRQPAAGFVPSYAQGDAASNGAAVVNGAATAATDAAAAALTKKRPVIPATGTPVPAVTPPNGATPAPPLQFKGNSTGEMMSGFVPNVANVANGVIDDVKGAASAGNYAAAAGQAARGFAAIPAAINDLVARPFMAVTNPLINAAATAITGDNTPIVGPNAPANAAAAPAAAAVPAVASAAPAKPAVAGAIPTRAADSQAANSPATVAVPNGYTGPQGNPVGFDPSISKSVDAKGNVLYSNQSLQSNADLMAKNVRTPAASGFNADPALAAARSAAVDRRDIEAVRASYGGDFNAAAQPAAGSQVTIAPVRPLGFRTADQEPAATVDMRGLSANQRATLQAQMANNAENNATARANTAATTAVTREGQQANTKNAADRLALDKQHAGFANAKNAADTQSVLAITQAHQTLEAAKQGYAQAQATGDAKKIQAAEDQLRAAQGKWEKASPSGRIVVVQGGTAIGPNGETIHQPSQVYDAEQQKWLTPPPQQGNAPAQASKGIAEGTISTVNGKKAIFQNGKWVPQ